MNIGNERCIRRVRVEMAVLLYRPDKSERPQGSSKRDTLKGEMVVRLMFGLSRGRDDDDPSLEFILNHVP